MTPENILADLFPLQGMAVLTVFGINLNQPVKLNFDQFIDSTWSTLIQINLIQSAEFN